MLILVKQSNSCLNGLPDTISSLPPITLFIHLGFMSNVS